MQEKFQAKDIRAAAAEIPAISARPLPVLRKGECKERQGCDPQVRFMGGRVMTPRRRFRAGSGDLPKAADPSSWPSRRCRPR